MAALPEEVQLLGHHSEASVLGQVQGVVADQVSSIQQILNLHSNSAQQSKMPLCHKAVPNQMTSTKPGDTY